MFEDATGIFNESPTRIMRLEHRMIGDKLEQIDQARRCERFRRNVIKPVAGMLQSGRVYKAAWR
jgi:hypothetical protein